MGQLSTLVPPAPLDGLGQQALHHVWVLLLLVVVMAVVAPLSYLASRNGGQPG